MGLETLAASTGEDSTNYFYSFPSNRIELWFLLESERFLHPVFREFYKERDVVREERRMRIESSPQGQLIEALSSTAFAAHPYKNTAAGWARDIEHLRATDAEVFYKRYYGPSNLHLGLAGGGTPERAKRQAENAIGRHPGRHCHPLLTAGRPPDTSPNHDRRLTPVNRLSRVLGQRPAEWWRFEVDPRCQSPLLSWATSSVSRSG